LIGIVYREIQIYLGYCKIYDADISQTESVHTDEMQRVGDTKHSSRDNRTE